MSEIEVKHLSKTFEQKGVHVDALKDRGGRYLRDHWNVRCRKKYFGTMPELFGKTDRRSGVDRRKRSWNFK